MNLLDYSFLAFFILNANIKKSLETLLNQMVVTCIIQGEKILCYLSIVLCSCVTVTSRQTCVHLLVICQQNIYCKIVFMSSILQKQNMTINEGNDK